MDEVRDLTAVTLDKLSAIRGDLVRSDGDCGFVDRTVTVDSVASTVRAANTKELSATKLLLLLNGNRSWPERNYVSIALLAPIEQLNVKASRHAKYVKRGTIRQYATSQSSMGQRKSC